MATNFDDFECAGHHFSRGRCVSWTSKNGENAICGQEWLTIQYCGKDDIGKAGIAHSGVLSSYEASEILAKKAEFDKRWMINLGWSEGKVGDSG